MKNEDSTCFISIFLLLGSAVPLVVWAASPSAHPFLGTLGVVLYLAGGVFGIYGAHLATEPGETIAEMGKTVPTASGIAGGALVMRKTAGS
jgi:VIT1/CCC1 family predicted Fe2+/Mn2+ transporter